MGLVRVGVERGDGPGNSGGVHSSGVHNSGVRNSNASKASGATARGGNQHLAEAVAEAASGLVVLDAHPKMRFNAPVIGLISLKGHRHNPRPASAMEKFGSRSSRSQADGFTSVPVQPQTSPAALGYGSDAVNCKLWPQQQNTRCWNRSGSGLT